MNENNNTIPENSEEISQKLTELSGASIMQKFTTSPRLTHIEEEAKRTALKQEWITRIEKFDWNKVWEDVQEQVEKTYASLLWKFQSAKKKLSSLDISPNDVADACIERLLNLLDETSKGKRKLTNGNVISLAKIKESTLHTKTIGYYEFACCNVSLDTVKVKWKSLREISDACDDTNDNGDFLLPNSCWVSISLMAKDNSWKPCFIGQFRNNNTTLTQRDSSKVVAAASGAIDASERNIWDMAKIELSEELGISGEVKKIHDSALKIMTWEQWQQRINVGSQVLEDELWVNIGSIDVAGIIWEPGRKNPEIVLRASTDLTTNEIEKLWNKAKDKDESTGIRAIPLEEIWDNLSWEKETLENHFLQSLLAWYM